MNRLMTIVMPIKTFAAMIFVGFMILYMISGALFTLLTGEEYVYAIPFPFVLQGLVLSLVIAVLWEVFFGGTAIKNMRFFGRFIAFIVTLAILFVACILTIFAIPTEWTMPWSIAVLCVMVGLVVLSSANELYLRKTGVRYTEALMAYKEKLK